MKSEYGEKDGGSLALLLSLFIALYLVILYLLMSVAVCPRLKGLLLLQFNR